MVTRARRRVEYQRVPCGEESPISAGIFNATLRGVRKLVMSSAQAISRLGFTTRQRRFGAARRIGSNSSGLMELGIGRPR